MNVPESTLPRGNEARPGRGFSLGLLGVNYRSASLDIRENVSRCLSKNHSKLLDAKADGLLNGAAIVSTCNRSEVVFSAEETNFAEATTFLKAKIFTNSGKHSRHVERSAAEMPWYVFRDEAVPRHIFKVATGLDSMITGEAQILGQLKFAYKNSVQEGLIESTLHRLFQSAFRTAKLVRTTTGIGRGTVSIASASKLAVQSIFGDLSRLKYLIIGAGDTASLIARYLRDAGATSFFVANRTQDNSRSLSALVNGVSIPLSRISEVLPLVDVVVSAVSLNDEKRYVVSHEELSEISAFDPSKKYVFLDVSVPRSIEPRIQEIPSVYLFDIDDFASIRDSSLESRQKEAVRADIIIRDQVARYYQWIKERERCYLIRELMRKFSNESAREWIRTSRKLRKQNFSEDNVQMLAEVIFQHQESVFFRFMHPVFSSLKESSPEEIRSLVHELFSLPEMSNPWSCGIDPFEVSLEQKM